MKEISSIWSRLAAPSNKIICIIWGYFQLIKTGLRFIPIRCQVVPTYHRLPRLPAAVLLLGSLLKLGIRESWTFVPTTDFRRTGTLDIRVSIPLRLAPKGPGTECDLLH